MNRIGVKAHQSAIGIELDTHEFRAVQLSRSGDQHHALAWAVFPRLNQHDESRSDTQGAALDAAELNWAKSILSRRGFRGNLISCSPRPRDCTQHVLELPPPDSGAPLETLARVEVARARKCEQSAFEFGYWSLPQRGRNHESMAVACPTKVIDNIITTYNSCDMQVAGIDLPELAIMRGVSHTSSLSTPTEQPEIDVVLQINWNSSLAIVTLGKHIVYVRRIAHGAKDVWELARTRYNLSQISAAALLDRNETTEENEPIQKVRTACWSALSKELIAEIDVAITYVSHSFRTAPLGRVIMCGYGVMNQTLLKRLDQVLGLPAVRSEPDALLNAMKPEDDPALPARLTYAYGLAARFDA